MPHSIFIKIHTFKLKNHGVQLVGVWGRTKNGRVWLTKPTELMTRIVSLNAHTRVSIVDFNIWLVLAPSDECRCQGHAKCRGFTRWTCLTYRHLDGNRHCWGVQIIGSRIFLTTRIWSLNSCEISDSDTSNYILDILDVVVEISRRSLSMSILYGYYNIGVWWRKTTVIGNNTNKIISCPQSS